MGLNPTHHCQPSRVPEMQQGFTLELGHLSNSHPSHAVLMHSSTTGHKRALVSGPVDHHRERALLLNWEKPCSAKVERIKCNSQEVSHEPSENHDDGVLENVPVLQTRLLKLLIRNIKIQPCRAEMSLANTWSRRETYSCLGPRSPTYPLNYDTWPRNRRNLSYLLCCYKHPSWPEK